MTCSKTKRVSKYAAIAWLCLLAIIVIVRAVNLPLGSVQPEAVMLTFMLTLPFTLGLTCLVIGAAWVLERRGRLGPPFTGGVFVAVVRPDRGLAAEPSRKHTPTPLAVSRVLVIAPGPPLHPSHGFLTVGRCGPRVLYAPMTPTGKHSH